MRSYRLVLSLAAAAALAASGNAAAAQTCAEPHYRWSEKTSLALAGETPHAVSIHTILTAWPVPAIYGGGDKCAERSGRELTVYSVTGWIRRRLIENSASGDLDWHIELTASATGTVPDHCLVAEIPDPQFGAQFQVARDQFTALLSDAGATIDSRGDLSVPVHVKIVGPAFFDGEHRGARGTTNPPHAHGRCNSSSRSLWEIHGVFAVLKPGS